MFNRNTRVTVDFRENAFFLGGSAEIGAEKKDAHAVTRFPN